ncbi:hypothetical protein BS47DRAFT_1379168 [Hydnum rufescens UP504]|uniref:DUF6534 domain-containing protein n=1 Tax=Hydnum rufescens UP504 TaxID=1448309 RepID=A0A9P6B8Q6_9AGAM|nr:hypothetical protein BS47DRAFT_1379168 [Hydnum rufescens UP504]
MKKLLLKNVCFVALYMVSDATLGLVIAGCTTTFLYRNSTGFKTTDTAMNRMVKYSISTGLVASVVCLASFVLFLTVGFTDVGVIVQVVSVRSYAMALLGNLHMGSNFKPRTVESIRVPLSIIHGTNGQVLRGRSGSTSLPKAMDGMQAVKNSKGTALSTRLFSGEIGHRIND